MTNNNANTATLQKSFFRNHHHGGPCKHFERETDLGYYDTVHTYLRDCLVCSSIFR